MFYTHTHISSVYTVVIIEYTFYIYPRVGASALEHCLPVRAGVLGSGHMQSSQWGLQTELRQKPHIGSHTQDTAGDMSWMPVDTSYCLRGTFLAAKSNVSCASKPLLASQIIY